MDEVRIPGKVMLSGEYAVLAGAWAVMLPLERWLTARRADRAPEAGYSPVVNCARALAIRETAAHEAGRGVPHLVLDDTAFKTPDANGRLVKLGIGGSSAEAVATVALRFECAGLPWIQHWRRIAALARMAHGIAASGRGSGADIAACAFRAPLLYRLDGERREPQYKAVLPADTAPAVPLCLAWTGRPADTRDMLKRYYRWQERGGDAALLARLADVSDRLAPAWFSAGEDELFTLVDEHAALMDELAAAAGLSYRLPVHARLEAWARRHGGRAKPTGAGGGDMLLMIGDLPLDQLGELLIIELG